GGSENSSQENCPNAERNRYWRYSPSMSSTHLGKPTSSLKKLLKPGPAGSPFLATASATAAALPVGADGQSAATSSTTTAAAAAPAHSRQASRPCLQEAQPNTRSAVPSISQPCG